jgi:aspartokinase
MINISDTVSQVLHEDEVAQEALREGLLNFSAYAEKIQARIADLAMKPVKKGTIVVALTRIRNGMKEAPSLRQSVQFENLSVKSSLSVYTFEKTLEIQRKIAVLHPFLLPLNDLISITEGSSEVTIVVADKSSEMLKKHFSVDPLVQYSDAAAITVQFLKKFATTPNFLYSVFSILASKRINIIEVVSTYTEMTFIVKKEDMTGTLSAFNRYFVRKEIHEK